MRRRLNCRYCLPRAVISVAILCLLGFVSNAVSRRAAEKRMAQGISTALSIMCPHVPVVFGIPFPSEGHEQANFSYGPTRDLISSLKRSKQAENNERAVVCLSRGKNVLPFVVVVHGGWRYKGNGFECKALFVTFYGLAYPVGSRDRRFS